MPGRSSPVEPLVGFEPTACWLQISCSTAELQRHILLFLWIPFHNIPGVGRDHR